MTDPTVILVPTAPRIAARPVDAHKGTFGKVLVAVEVHGPDSQARLALAERILANAGTDPVPLVEG